MKPTPLYNTNYTNNICLRKMLELLDSAAYDLIGGFSMKPYGLIFLKNEILLNKRENILEFGSGLSTIFMALTIRKYKIKARITSIESDMVWVNKLNEKIKELNLSDIVQVLFVPLVADKRIDPDAKWYDATRLKEITDKIFPFDMVVIDGPAANKNILNRYGAMPYVYGHLAKEHVIFLDDANRVGERKVTQLWEDKYHIKFHIYQTRTAVYRKGPYLNSHPSILNSQFFLL